MIEQNLFLSSCSWLLGDHLGSTSVVTDDDGDVVSEVRYSAFGETRYQNGTLSTDYLYTGQRQEAEIGLYYYVARWYDPAIGRFVQADSVVPNPASAVGFDRYAYAGNNPLSYVDPSGHHYCDWNGNGCEDYGDDGLYGSDDDWKPGTWSYGGGGNGGDPFDQFLRKESEAEAESLPRPAYNCWGTLIDGNCDLAQYDGCMQGVYDYYGINLDFSSQSPEYRNPLAEAEDLTHLNSQFVTRSKAENNFLIRIHLDSTYLPNYERVYLQVLQSNYEDEWEIARKNAPSLTIENIDDLNAIPELLEDIEAWLKILKLSPTSE